MWTAYSSRYAGGAWYEGHTRNPRESGDFVCSVEPRRNYSVGAPGVSGPGIGLGVGGGGGVGIGSGIGFVSFIIACMFLQLANNGRQATSTRA